jgi:HSP20 family protein
MFRHRSNKKTDEPAGSPEAVASTDVGPVASDGSPAETLPDWFSRVAANGIRVSEVDDHGTHVVRAELPGIDPDKDVDITVDRGLLVIRAHRREEQRSEVDGQVCSEFSYGSFTRSLPLPAGATEDDVKATYRDGILEIRFPIDTEAAALHKVPITRA